jgi:hypothetical protein
MPNLNGRRLQSKVAACRTSEVVGSEAATGGRGGVDGSRGRGGINSNREVRCGIRLGMLGGMGSNQPRITTQVQPPHKIHPGAE